MTLSLDACSRLALDSMFQEQGGKTTLWMGDLEPWMDEQFIQQLWYRLGYRVVAKVIRDRVTSTSAGYAFVDFGSVAKAQAALESFNGLAIPSMHKTLKLNWASGGGLIDRREDRQPEYSIFVGDLSPDCTESMLWTKFARRYASCKSVKIMTDSDTGMSRGYGFVRFTSPEDQKRALFEMKDVMVCGRALRVSVATPKPPNNHQRGQRRRSTSPATTSPKMQQDDPNNTTVFVGGLSAPITEEDLRQYFSPFGDIVYTKIPPGKGCGFVQFVSRQSAETAIKEMNGYQIGRSRIRLSWGRSQNDRSAAAAAAMAAAATAAAAMASSSSSRSLSSSTASSNAVVSSVATTETPRALADVPDITTYPSIRDQFQESSYVNKSLLAQSLFSNDWISRASNDSLLGKRNWTDFSYFSGNKDNGGKATSSQPSSSTSIWNFSHIYAQQC